PAALAGSGFSTARRAGRVSLELDRAAKAILEPSIFLQADLTWVWGMRAIDGHVGFGNRQAISSRHCNARGTGGTSTPLPVPVRTTTDAVVPARSLTVSGTFSRCTMTGMRCASRIHSKVGLTEGNSWKPVLPFCWAIPQPMLSTLPCNGVSG